MSKDRSVFLLLGPEAGQKDRFVDGLKKELAKSAGGEPEVHRFYPFDTKVADILAVLRNGSLFSGRRLAIVSCLEELTGREELKLLADYCARPAPDATLLLLSDASVLPRSFEKLEKAIPAENRKVFWEMFDSQKTGWIAQFFLKKEIAIEAEASALLLELVENNTRQMEIICEQLARFFGPGARIGPQDIERTLSHSKEENVFTLFDRLVLRDLGSSLEVLQKILLSRSEESNPVQLLGGLLFQFRRLKALRLLLEQGYPWEEACTRLRIRGKRVQRTYQEGARRYSLRELEDIVLLIGDFDLRLRSARASLEAFLLKMLLYYVVMRGGRGAWRDGRVHARG